MPDQSQLRPARKSDSRTIARLYSVASDGVADTIWAQRAAPGDALLMMKHL